MLYEICEELEFAEEKNVGDQVASYIAGTIKEFMDLRKIKEMNYPEFAEYFVWFFRNRMRKGFSEIPEMSRMAFVASDLASYGSEYGTFVGGIFRSRKYGSLIREDIVEAFDILSDRHERLLVMLVFDGMRGEHLSNGSPKWSDYDPDTRLMLNVQVSEKTFKSLRRARAEAREKTADEEYILTYKGQGGIRKPFTRHRAHVILKRLEARTRKPWLKTFRRGFRTTYGYKNNLIFFTNQWNTDSPRWSNFVFKWNRGLSDMYIRSRISQVHPSASDDAQSFQQEHFKLKGYSGRENDNFGDRRPRSPDPLGSKQTWYGSYRGAWERQGGSSED